MVFNPYTDPSVQATIDAQKQAWRDEYERLFISYCGQNEFIEGGKFCEHARKSGLGEPHHHNVWPAMVMSMAKKGYVVKHSDTQPTTKHSHIKVITLWKSCLYKP